MGRRVQTTEDDCGYFDPSPPRPERSTMSDYRAELFGACECEEAPFWLAVEGPDGSERTEDEALKVVNDYWGEAVEGWKVSRAQMYLGQNEHGDLRVNVKPDGMQSGPFAFWQIDEVD